MIVRFTAWIVVLVVGYGVWHYVHDWHSPLDVSSPVLSQLPPAAAPCGVDCK